MIFGLFNQTKDPVCSMKINKKEAKFSLEKEGEKYYFCSENCKRKFATEPKKYEIEKDHSCCH